MRILNLSLKELKLIAKNRGVKDYKRMSRDELLRILNASKPIKKNYFQLKKNSLQTNKKKGW